MGNRNAFNYGTQDRYFNGAMHVGSRWDQVWSEANSVTWPYSVEDTFHIVTMIWTPTSIDMYMDKESHPELNAYFHADLEPNENADYDRSVVFGKPNFVIANLAVGGDFPGFYQVNQISALNNGPCKMYIDWIRIYQRGDANESFVSPAASDAIEPEPENWLGIENVQSDKGQCTKVIENGVLYLMYKGTRYNVQGQRVK